MRSEKSPRGLPACLIRATVSLDIKKRRSHYARRTHHDNATVTNTKGNQVREDHQLQLPTEPRCPTPSSRAHAATKSGDHLHGPPAFPWVWGLLGPVTPSKAGWPLHRQTPARHTQPSFSPSTQKEAGGPFPVRPRVTSPPPSPCSLGESPPSPPALPPRGDRPAAAATLLDRVFRRGAGVPIRSERLSVCFSRRMDRVAVCPIGPSGLSESMWSACLARLEEGNRQLRNIQTQRGEKATMSSLR